MNPVPESSGNKEFLTRSLEVTIRIGVVFLLAALCFQILRPFLIPVLWGIIIAIAVFPAYRWLELALNGRSRIAALCVSLVLLVILLVPTVMLADTLVETVRILAKKLQTGTLEVPPPPASVATWPLIGEPLDAFWRAASQNLALALKPVTPQLKALGTWLLSSAAEAGLGILQFLAAIIISGMLLAHTQLGARTAHTLGIRLAGDQGADYIDVAEATVRSVARGILGVAIIQSLLAGLGFLFVGIPGAGLWAFIALFLSVIQIGVIPVTLPMVIYVFATADPVTAIIFLVWNIFVSAIDNLLKPVLLGRGVRVPMLVIFAGSIGGFLALGIIGLFTGAVVLALGYKLFLAWMEEAAKPGQPQEQADTE
jgi:predicted PurR-regulated permease PerM